MGHGMRKTSRKVVRVVGAVLLLVTGLAFILFLSLGVLFKNTSEPVQDPSRYEEVLAEYDGGPEVIAHFPSHIPETATEVALYYMPRVLQGGSRFRLSYKLPSSELETIVEQYRPIAHQIKDGRRSSNIPEDFEVFYLDDSDSPNWNGYAYGVAISMERQEIIYWAEDMRT